MTTLLSRLAAIGMAAIELIPWWQQSLEATQPLEYLLPVHLPGDTDDWLVGGAQMHFITFVDAQDLRHVLRNADRKAVSPFRYLHIQFPDIHSTRVDT